MCVYKKCAYQYICACECMYVCVEKVNVCECVWERVYVCVCTRSVSVCVCMGTKCVRVFV
jgi:hypothetical protein